MSAESPDAPRPKSANISGDSHADAAVIIDDTCNSTQCEERESASSQLYRIGVGEKGRGLFAMQDILPNTLLHVAPCIRIPKQEYDNHMRHTVLEHYLFNDTSHGNKLLALGHGSLFNHARQPNVDYRVDSPNLCIRYTTGHKGISKGEELCINYGGNLWFDDTDGTGNDTSSSCSGDSVQDGVASFLGRMEL